MSTTSARYWRIISTDISWTTRYGNYNISLSRFSLYSSPDLTGTDLALAGTATASSIYNGGYPASLTIDGSESSHWTSLPNRTNPDWLQVTLLTEQVIRSFSVNWYQAGYSPKSYDLQYSLDGTTWVTAASATTTATGGVVNTINISEIGYATWNPSDKTSYLALSNNDLTGTPTSSFPNTASARANLGKSTGKWYWEITCTGSDSSGYELLGVSNSSWIQTTTRAGYVGIAANTWGYCPALGRKYYLDIYSSYGIVSTSGCVIGFALDMDGGTLSISVNGVSYGVMYSGLTGTLFPSISTTTEGYTCTANFGATPFTYNVPVGFNKGLYAANYATLSPYTSPAHYIGSGVLSTIGKSSGKWYCEVKASVIGYLDVGISILNTSYVDADTSNGVAYRYYSVEGRTFANGARDKYWATWGVGDTIGVALDMDSGTAYWYKNNVLQGSYSGLTGTWYIALTNAWTSTSVATVNFGESAFTYNPPVGFNKGLYDEIDNYNDKIILYLEGEGTSIVDTSICNHAITNVGGVSLSTTKVRHGVSSLHFNNSGYSAGVRLDISDRVSDFVLNGDFTIEVSFYPITMGTTWGSCLLDTRASSLGSTGYSLAYGMTYNNNASKITFGFSEGGITADVAPVLDSWNTIVIVRSGSLIRMYVNNVIQTGIINSSNVLPASEVHIGSTSNIYNGTGINCYIDNFRITKGVARLEATPENVTDVKSIASGLHSQLISFIKPSYLTGVDVYTVVATSDVSAITVTGASSPILVTGLEDGTEYTFTVSYTIGSKVITSLPSAKISTLSSDSYTFISLGQRSFKLIVPANSLVEDVLWMLESSIPSYGWEVYDSVSHVYRALNKDGVTYKYLRLLVTGNSAITEVYESWNATTHVGLNRAGPPLSGQIFDDYDKTAFVLTSTELVTITVYASSQWFAIGSYFTDPNKMGKPINYSKTTYIRSIWVTISNNYLTSYDLMTTDYSGMSGVFEFSRENLEVNNDVPCFFWTHTAYIIDDKGTIDTAKQDVSNVYAYYYDNKASETIGYVPRAKDASGTSYTNVPISLTTPFVSQMNGRYLNGVNTVFPVNVFNGANPVIDLFCKSPYSFLGGIYGLKVCRPDGIITNSNVSKDFICDDNFNIVRVGIVTTHLPILSRIVKNIYSYSAIINFYGSTYWGGYNRIDGWSSPTLSNFDYKSRCYIPA